MKSIVIAFGLTCALAAQGSSCPDLGSQRTAGRIDLGPTLGCAFAPTAPAWRLVVPPYRAAVPHLGFTRREYRTLPQVLVRYECTGLVLFPVRIAEVRTLGTLIDVTEQRCH